MVEASLRVIKLGGSLFDLQGLPQVFRRWLALQPPADNLLLAGGGPFADAIRDADRRHRLGEEASHWLCIRAMDLTAQLLAALLSEAQLVDDLSAQEPKLPGRLRVLEPWRLLDAAERRDDIARLPHSWDVTSDSIAAWIAMAFNAQELVLLKSALPQASSDMAGAIREGLLDRYVARSVGQNMEVRCVNLRSTDFQEARL